MTGFLYAVELRREYWIIWEDEPCDRRVLKSQEKSFWQNTERKDLYEWNARVQITTWGNWNAADDGGLRDYAHKEWNGILKDFYYMR